jgi:hypothetical protein
MNESMYVYDVCVHVFMRVHVHAVITFLCICEANQEQYGKKHYASSSVWSVIFFAGVHAHCAGHQKGGISSS